MFTFPQLIKKIRDEAGLTQAEFARAVGVSAVLVAMVETGQKEVSKNLVLKLAELMDVHPASITPFLYSSEGKTPARISNPEKMLLNWGEKMQVLLIKKGSKKLKKYAKN
jgi:transcriptional regulator with XRE-family HTH domain